MSVLALTYFLILLKEAGISNGEISISSNLEQSLEISFVKLTKTDHNSKGPQFIFTTSSSRTQISFEVGIVLFDSPLG